MEKNLLPSIALLFITTLLFGGAIGYFLGYEHGASTLEEETSSINVTSFEECVAAGYPVMESYPEQCRTPDGKHFTREIEEPDAILEPTICTMDARICPDGTAVGRTGPNCEFAPCP